MNKASQLGLNKAATFKDCIPLHRFSNIICFYIFIPNNTDQDIKSNPSSNSITYTWNYMVKLSLCLTKHDAMKTYTLLNYAPCHEDTLGNGGVAPCILNLGIR
jgi:hypothetical protein